MYTYSLRHFLEALQRPDADYVFCGLGRNSDRFPGSRVAAHSGLGGLFARYVDFEQSGQGRHSSLVSQFRGDNCLKGI